MGWVEGVVLTPAPAPPTLTRPERSRVVVERMDGRGEAYHASSVWINTFSEVCSQTSNLQFLKDIFAQKAQYILAKTLMAQTFHVKIRHCRALRLICEIKMN